MAAASWGRRLGLALAAATIVAAGGCRSTPRATDADGPALAAIADLDDQRGRFREIYCAVLEARGDSLPDSRPCGQALARVGVEPGGTGTSVDLGPSDRHLVAAVVPGVGWACFSEWLDMKATARDHVRRFGYDLVGITVDALSSSAANAGQIRNAIMAMELDGDRPRLVLIGYSKGAPDILEALVAYPEIRGRIAAVVSAAGAVGGSPLAADMTESELELLKHWPQAKCSPGDGGAINSLLPDTRKAWLTGHQLPDDIPFYSLVTYPQRDNISSVLKPSYRKLGGLDEPNDGMVRAADQVIPGSTLLGFVNADHWALAVPIDRSHPTLGATLVDDNDYPREALLEAVLRFVEEDLSASSR